MKPATEGGMSGAMSTTAYILMISVMRCLFMAGAFLGVFALDRTRRHCLYFAAALTGAYVYNLLRTAYPDLNHQPLTHIGLAALMILAFASLNTGLALRYRAPIDRRLLAGVAIGGLAFNVAIALTMSVHVMHNFAVFLPLLGMVAIAIRTVAKFGRRRFTDGALQGMLLLAGAYFLFKVSVAIGSGFSPWFENWQMNAVYGISTRLALNMILTGIALALIAVEVADTINELNDRIKNDALTAIYNRHGFDTHARAMLAEPGADAAAHCLIVSDLDNFKAVNDTFGHAGGDAVICAFAKAIADATGVSGICGRMGGEEFSILLRHVDVTTARLFVETVRTRFAAEPIADLPAEARFTASFGITRVSGPGDLDAAYRRADRALYRAKDAGRNCVELADETGGALSGEAAGRMDRTSPQPFGGHLRAG